MTSFVKPSRVPRIQRSFVNLKDTIRTVFWHDVYEVRRMNRPAGWDTGVEPESWTMVENGLGKLSVAGDGGTSLGEDVILNISPYRFRLRRSTVLMAGDELVVNTRHYLVKGVTRRDGDHEFATATLDEIFVRPEQP